LHRRLAELPGPARAGDARPLAPRRAALPLGQLLPPAGSRRPAAPRHGRAPPGGPSIARHPGGEDRRRAAARRGAGVGPLPALRYAPGVSLEAFGVKNLRCLTDTGLVPIRPITVLVGRNSSGKSTFLRAFPLLRQSVETERKSPILWYH